MPDEEHKEEEQKKEGEHKEGEHDKGKGESPKQKKLLWWGLGLAGAGLLVSLLLFNNSSNSGTAAAQTVANPSTPFVPNPTNPYDASANEYWPVPTSNPVTGQPTGTTTGGTSSSSGSGSKKKKSSGSSKKSSSSSKKSSSSSHTTTKITPHHTVAAKPHAGGAHGYVYTVQKGDTLQSLQNKAWPGSSKSTNAQKAVKAAHGAAQYTSNTNIKNYANNAAILKASGGKLKPGMKINL